MSFYIKIPFVFALLLSTSGCFGVKSKTIPINDLPLISDEEAKTHRLDTTDGALVVIAMETCDARVKRYSHQSNLRQMVAGFKQVRVEEVNNLTINGKQVTRARMSCSENNRPIHLLTYSIQTSPCITEVVSWREDGKAISEIGDSALKNLVISFLEKRSS